MTVPTWASNTNVSAGPYAGAVTTKVTPTAGELADGTVPGESFKGQHVNWMLNFLSRANTSVYGDGSDGAGTITGGTTTLTRDMYYENLTVEATGLLDANGYRVFVRDTCTIAVGGVIHSDGSAGNAGTPPQAGGVGASAGSIQGGTDGGDSPASSDTAGDPGVNATDACGGAGGAGGDALGSVNRAGGAGGTVTAPAAADGGFRHLDAAYGSLKGATYGQQTGGAGGGSGGSGDAGYGGSGGGGGGVLCVFALNLVNNGTIRSAGGAGGNATAGDGGEGGGGGGGGGGLVYVVARSRSGSGTVTAPGGAGGTGIAGGDNGAAGSAGRTFEFYA